VPIILPVIPEAFDESLVRSDDKQAVSPADRKGQQKNARQDKASGSDTPIPPVGKPRRYPMMTRRTGLHRALCVS